MTARRWLAAAVVAMAISVVALSGVGKTEQTLAAWQRPMFHQATVTSVSLAPIALACTSAGGLLSGSIGFNWPAPAATPVSYKFTWTPAFGTPVVTPLPGTATSIAIPGSSLTLLTTYTATIVAEYGGTWTTTVSPTRTVLSVLGLPGLNTYTCS